jgi:hypothetical protein
MYLQTAEMTISVFLATQRSKGGWQLESTGKEAIYRGIIPQFAWMSRWNPWKALSKAISAPAEFGTGHFENLRNTVSWASLSSELAIWLSYFAKITRAEWGTPITRTLIFHMFPLFRTYRWPQYLFRKQPTAANLLIPQHHATRQEVYSLCIFIHTIYSRDSSVSFATGYVLGGRSSIPERPRDLSLYHRVQTGSGAHLLPNGYRGRFPKR